MHSHCIETCLNPNQFLHTQSFLKPALLFAIMCPYRHCPAPDADGQWPLWHYEWWYDHYWQRWRSGWWEYWHIVCYRKMMDNAKVALMGG